MDQLILQRQKYGSGDQIFKEGDEGRLAYVVEEGEVEIFVIIDDHEQVLGTVGKDGIFGEMALIDNQPRMANARATKSTTIICVTRQMFDEKLNQADPFIRGLLKILADNNRDITSKWLMALN